VLFVASFVVLPIFTVPPINALSGLETEVLSYSLILNNLFAVTAYYLNYYYFIPFFNLRAKYITYAIALTVTTLMALLIPFACNFLLRYLGWEFRFIDFLNAPVGPVFMLSFAFMLSYILRRHNEWKQVQRDKMEMEMQRNAAEVMLLRNQINPHFFFNTLNGIYSMALQQSGNIPAVLLQLSDMMRYVLYDSNAEKVPLEKEMAYMQQYVKMQEMRLGKNNHVNFEVSGITDGILITPLLMIPFLENNFEYGISGNVKTNMKMSIDCSDGKLRFISSNTIVSGNGSKDHGGIGISNVKRRLELDYHNRYDLQIKQQGDEFTVKLDLNL
jgi:sensor histidine kinase YesM